MQSSMRKLLGKPTAAASNGPAHNRNSDGSKDDGKSQGGTSSRPSTSPAVPLLYHPVAPQEASFQVGVPIAALDKSPDGRSSILAGRHVLKSVRVDGIDIQEAFDLRAIITAQTQTAPRTTNSTAVSVAEQLSIRDVKWGRGRNDVHIFTACLRGKIFQYDLSRLGARASTTAVGGGGGIGGSDTTIDMIQMQEDTRQINTLDINPNFDAFLLSGSQDGYVRLFDTRKLVADHRLGTTFKHVQGFKCNADVRDVQWSPRDGFLFACCTEQGMVMKWDIRKGGAPLQRIAAHENACASISWHPDGEHLISGGVDKACHVWDMSKTADKRQKAKYTLYTPASVAAVTWRPGQWSATLEGLRAAQVAVSYDVSGHQRPGINAVHVWDLARPTIPYKTIERFKSSPSALLWKDQEFLWTAGEDGLFCQNDVTFAPRVIDRTAVSTLTFSSCGDVLTFLDERPPQPKATKVASATATATATVAAATADHHHQVPHSSSKLVFSRSDSEDDVVHTFVMPRRRRRRRGSGRMRRASSVPNVGSTSTPPSSSQARDGSSGSNRASKAARQIQNQNNNNNSNNLPVSLDKALRATGTYRPQQIMAIGHIPSAARKDTYGYLANIYLETLEQGLPPTRRDGVLVPLPERVAGILEQYARAAEQVRQFRLAQVWRIIAFAMDLLFRRRGLYHKQKRLEGPKKAPSKEEAQRQSSQETSQGQPSTESRAEAADSSSSTAQKKSLLSNSNSNSNSNSASTDNSITTRTLPVRSLLTEEIESTSNMPTPLARPVSGGMAYLGEHFQGLPPAPGDDFPISTSFGSIGGDIIESLDLPPAQYKDYMAKQPARRHLDSLPLSEISHASHNSHNSEKSSIEGYDFYDTEAMAHAIDVPGASRGGGGGGDVGSSSGGNGLSKPPPVHFSHATGDVQEDLPASKLSDSPIRTPDFHRQDAKHKHEHEQQAAPLASSAGSTRLLRLNKALMSMEWSGSDLTMSSATAAATAASNTRPMLQRSASSRLDAMSIATSEFLPMGEEEEGDDADADDNDNDDRLTDKDYLPWPHDPPFPYPVEGLPASGLEAHSSALNPYTIIGRALAFEVRTSPLNASAMVLLLKPLVPDDVIDPLQAKAILRQHHTRLMGMKLFLAAALLRKLCVPGWPVTMSGHKDTPTSHDLSKWGATGTTEMGGVAAYTSITAPAQKNVAVSYLCVTCRKPREIEHDRSKLYTGSGGSGADDSIWKCGRCRSVMAPCAVCGHRDVSALAPLEDRDSDKTDADDADDAAASVLSTWWYCVGCAHGGHLTCLEGWHSSAGPAGAGFASSSRIPDAGTGTEFSDGCCPLDGCGHACLPGQWRNEANVQRSDDLSRTVLNSSSFLSASSAGIGGGGGGVGGDTIRSDGNDVGQSRAVDMVRENLGVLGTSPGRTSLLGGLGGLAGFGGGDRSNQSSAGHYGGEPRERERRKSVKFAGTDGL